MYADPSGCFAISSFLISLAVGWVVTTIASQIFGAHLVGGISSTVGGVQTIGVGISLLAFGPVGWVLGGIAIASGALSIAFGTAELQQHFTGNNWMKDAGMSDGWYTGLMIGNAIVGAAVSIGGVKYMNSMHGQRAYTLQHLKKYTYTDTLLDANHAARAYNDSLLLQREVIKYGKMTPARGNTPFKYTYTIDGGLNGSTGSYELTVKTFERLITHWLFRGI